MFCELNNISEISFLIVVVLLQCLSYQSWLKKSSPASERLESCVPGLMEMDDPLFNISMY